MILSASTKMFIQNKTDGKYFDQASYEKVYSEFNDQKHNFTLLNHSLTCEVGRDFEKEDLALDFTF